MTGVRFALPAFRKGWRGFDPQAWITRGDRLDDGSGAIGRAIVEHDHLNIGMRAGKCCLDAGSDRLLFVARWNEDRYGWRH